MKNENDRGMYYANGIAAYSQCTTKKWNCRLDSRTMMKTEQWKCRKNLEKRPNISNHKSKFARMKCDVTKANKKVLRKLKTNQYFAGADTHFVYHREKAICNASWECVSKVIALHDSHICKGETKNIIFALSKLRAILSGPWDPPKLTSRNVNSQIRSNWKYSEKCAKLATSKTCSYLQHFPHGSPLAHGNSSVWTFSTSALVITVLVGFWCWCRWFFCTLRVLFVFYLWLLFHFNLIQCIR